MWFSYTPIPRSNSEIIYLPLINVALKFPSGEFKTKALIDSGADKSLFDFEILTDMGIATTGLDSIIATGAGGNEFNICHYPTNAYVDHKAFTKFIFKLDTSFCSMKNPNTNSVGMNLLGREDFFSAFRVEFDNRGKRFRLEKYEKKH